MKAFIVANGIMNNDAFYRELFKTQKPDYIICVDGGARHLKRLGIIPDILVGDLDSIDEDEFQYYQERNVDIRKFPPKKDETDTQLAISIAMELPIHEIILLGATGSRMDHTLANLYLLQSILDRGYKGCILNEKNTIYLINDEIRIQGKRDTLVSLLPFTDQVSGITTKGLYYGLKNAVMDKENPYGISNRLIDNTACINIRSGLLLVILAVD